MTFWEAVAPMLSGEIVKSNDILLRIKDGYLQSCGAYGQRNWKNTDGFEVLLCRGRECQIVKEKPKKVFELHEVVAVVSGGVFYHQWVSKNYYESYSSIEHYFTGKTKTIEVEG